MQSVKVLYDEDDVAVNAAWQQTCRETPGLDVNDRAAYLVFKVGFLRGAMWKGDAIIARFQELIKSGE